MHVPIKVDYGVRALVDLALYGQNGPVRASDIARRTMIPVPFLAQVLHNLGKKNLVKSQRGPHGGHILASDPHKVSLNSVMEALVGVETSIKCLDDISCCTQVSSCSQREIWREVDTAVLQILRRTTVGQLVERTRTMQTQQLNLVSNKNSG